MVDSADGFASPTSSVTGKIQSWTPGAEKLLGWSEADAAGQHSCLIFTPKDKAMPRGEGIYVWLCEEKRPARMPQSEL